jgi:hypothetical protein
MVLFGKRNEFWNAFFCAFVWCVCGATIEQRLQKDRVFGARAPQPRDHQFVHEYVHLFGRNFTSCLLPVRFLNDTDDQRRVIVLVFNRHRLQAQHILCAAMEFDKFFGQINELEAAVREKNQHISEERGKSTALRSEFEKGSGVCRGEF